MLHDSFSLLPVFIKWIAVAGRSGCRHHSDILRRARKTMFFTIPHILDTFSRFLPW